MQYLLGEVGVVLGLLLVEPDCFNNSHAKQDKPNKKRNNTVGGHEQRGKDGGGVLTSDGR